MRFVRRASLVFSLTLIVAIAVGYVARRVEVAGERDLKLSTGAELAAVRFGSLVDAIELAAMAGTDPAVTADALAGLNPRFGVCASDAERTACAGVRSVTADEPLAPSAVRETGIATIAVYDATMTIDVAGPTLAIVVRAPADLGPAQSDLAVWATTFLPDGASVGTFIVDRGIRQTAAEVEGRPLVFVVAAGPNSVDLPLEEQRFYLIIFTLAVVLMLLAGVTIVIEHRSLVERASFDALTKLPNRGEFERRAADLLAAAERHSSGACLLLFDLNGFKHVNDTWGHYAGDEMLREVGARLRKAVRDSDVVARWGGDEFVVMMPGVGDEAMGAKRAHDLAAEISGRTRLESVPVPVRVTVSVGIATWQGPEQTVELLVEAADQAMYQAKREGLVCASASACGVPAVHA